MKRLDADGVYQERLVGAAPDEASNPMLAVVGDNGFRRGTSEIFPTKRLAEGVSRMCADAPDNHGVVYRDLDRVAHGRYRPRGG
jgi:hypothetical protein